MNKEDYSKYYIQGSDHYLIPKDVFDELLEENQKLKADYGNKAQVERDLLLEENKELKKQLEEVEFIVGLRQKRNLIHKFDKEYDEEDKKKNPNRDYAGIMPDAEEVYKRYYSMRNQQKEFINYLEDEIHSCEAVSYLLFNSNKEMKVYKEILQKYKDIIGDDK